MLCGGNLEDLQHRQNALPGQVLQARHQLSGFTDGAQWATATGASNAPSFFLVNPLQVTENIVPVEGVARRHESPVFVAQSLVHVIESCDFERLDGLSAMSAPQGDVELQELEHEVVDDVEHWTGFESNLTAGAEESRLGEVLLGNGDEFWFSSVEQQSRLVDPIAHCWRDLEEVASSFSWHGGVGDWYW